MNLDDICSCIISAVGLGSKACSIAFHTYTYIYPACPYVSRRYVIGTGVHLYVCIICDPQKSLNGTLAVDLPFQTLAVDLSLT